MIRFLARQFARPRGLAGRLLIGPWLDRIGAGMNRLALEELRLRPDDDVIEIGFGGGGLLAMILAATSGLVAGIDTSEAMVARARRRFRGEMRLSLAVASVETLPLQDRAFDRAVSVSNVYFWPDPAAGLAELARVLRPGGTVSICFEPPDELRKWPGHRFGFRLYEELELRALMEQAGFGEIRRAEDKGRKPDRFLCLTGTRRSSEAAS